MFREKNKKKNLFENNPSQISVHVRTLAVTVKCS